MNFLFWNVNKQAILDEIIELATQENIDFLMLAESGFTDIQVLKALNTQSSGFYFLPDYVCKKIQVFGKFEPQSIKPLHGQERFTIKSIEAPKIGHLNLVILHYQSKVNWDLFDQSAHVSTIKYAIDNVERKTGHKNTVVCGDFNMNPFDAGMVQTTGFHSIMDKRIVLNKKSRIVDGIEYNLMYNPMWSFLGDMSRGDVAGTIYYSPAKPINYHWNMFDQVLMRSEMIQYFDDEYLNIVTKIGSKSLINQNNLIDENYSDHLPIKFRFNF